MTVSKELGKEDVRHSNPSWAHGQTRFPCPEISMSFTVNAFQFPSMGGKSRSSGAKTSDTIQPSPHLPVQHLYELTAQYGPHYLSNSREGALKQRLPMFYVTLVVFIAIKLDVIILILCSPPIGTNLWQVLSKNFNSATSCLVLVPTRFYCHMV